MNSVFPWTDLLLVILILWIFSFADIYVSASPYGRRLPTSTSTPIKASQTHIIARYAQEWLSHGTQSIDSSCRLEVQAAESTSIDSYYNDDPGTTTTMSISYYSMHSWTYSRPHYPTTTNNYNQEDPGWTYAVEIARDEGWHALKIGARVAVIAAGAVGTLLVSAGAYICIRRRRGQ